MRDMGDLFNKTLINFGLKILIEYLYKIFIFRSLQLWN